MTVSFGLALYTGQTDADAGPRYGEAVVIARAAESAGFDTFWVSEHHAFADGYLPAPLVLLAGVATATTTLALGTSVLLAPLRHPVQLAEEAAVVDRLSDGRLVLGLGLGYVPDEYRMAGVPMRRRGQRLEEIVAILRRCWTGRRFSHHGDFYRLDDVRVTPTPVRAGGIPVWLGGYAAPAIRRAARIADGHLVGRGAPQFAERATECLSSIRAPGDPGFTLGIGLAVVGDDPAAAGASARRAFQAQQRAYEAVQTGTDVYADQLTVSGGDRLSSGTIDDYIDVRGDTAAVVAGIGARIRALRDWRELHVKLRIIFPGESLDDVVRRIDYFGRSVLPAVRAGLNT